ncbi:hypothetical protein GBO18_17625, partial [Mycobacterium avium subsp. hominissuis]|nr:hypothetical protein [Mycobacterium avium subsp. hominissuis]
VALVHGLLGCQAVDRRGGGPAAAGSSRDERHGPPCDAGCDRYPSSIASPARAPYRVGTCKPRRDTARADTRVPKPPPAPTRRSPAN